MIMDKMYSAKIADPRAAMEPQDLHSASVLAYPQVSAKRRHGSRLAPIGFSLTAIGLIAIAAHSASLPRDGRRTDIQSDEAGTSVTSPAAETQAQLQVSSTLQDSGLPVTAQIPAADPQITPPLASMPTAVPMEQPQSILIYDSWSADDQTETTGPAAVPPGPNLNATAQGITPKGTSPEEEFARRLGVGQSRSAASVLTAPSSTIVQGTLISAVLETGINSDLPGFVRAVVSRDVKSFDGTRVLIPRGSHIIGEYKSGLAVGQTRAYVLWSRLIRSDGVSIELGSPATDANGENGLSGKVDSHFGKRFGMSLLLSLISAGGQALGGGGAVVIAGPSQTAASVAQRDLNIPPTVRVKVGTRIGVFVARDLDFSTAEFAQ